MPTFRSSKFKRITKVKHINFLPIFPMFSSKHSNSTKSQYYKFKLSFKLKMQLIKNKCLYLIIVTNYVPNIKLALKQINFCAYS